MNHDSRATFVVAGFSRRSLAGRRTEFTIAFSRDYPGGVQFCFADGSVRTVPFGDTTLQHTDDTPSDWLLLQQLAGRSEDGTRGQGLPTDTS